MKFCVVVMALSRMEWPFIEEWCSILGDKGISKLYLGTHKTTQKVWHKKPNPTYYNLDMSDSEIESQWNKEVEKSRRFLDIEEQVIHGDDHEDLQCRFLQTGGKLAARDGYDWVLQCDVDEIPNQNLEHIFHKVNPETSVLRSDQILFESRFPKKKIRDLKKCNFKRVNCMKCFYDPKRAISIDQHNAKPLSGTRMFSKRFYFHHFRGIEPAFYKKMRMIKDFPHRAQDSTVETQIPLI